MRWWFLTDEDAADLAEHLGAVIPARALPTAMLTIDMGCAEAQSSRTASPGEWQRQRRISHRHFAAIANHAAVLRDLLRTERPLHNTAVVEWPAFDAALDVLIRSARVHAETNQPKSGRGRLPVEWRDRLVSLIYSVYPPGAATKTENSHFEDTVDRVLALLDAAVEDVHSVVLDALRRCPDAPYVVSPKPPTR